jgi:hypothetical protein
LRREWISDSSALNSADYMLLSQTGRAYSHSLPFSGLTIQLAPVALVGSCEYRLFCTCL